MFDEDVDDVLKEVCRDFQTLPPSEEEVVGGEFRTDGYFASTVGKHGDEGKFGKYVKNQGNEYQQLYLDMQLGLF